jgi:hypothetical protein
VADEEHPLGGPQRASFEVERAQLEVALKALAEEARNELERVTQNEKEMTTVFKSAAFKKALAANAELTPLVERSKETFAQDLAALKEAVTSIEARRRIIIRDLGKLAVLLR